MYIYTPFVAVIALAVIAVLRLLAAVVVYQFD